MAANFATLLRDHRRAAGLSQEELAESAEISAAAVGSYERGVRRAPHRVTLARMADALGLIGGERADFLTSAQRRLGHLRPPKEAAVVQMWRTLLDVQSDEQLDATANAAIDLLRPIDDDVDLALCWTLLADRLKRAGQHERARAAHNCARALAYDDDEATTKSA